MDSALTMGIAMGRAYSRELCQLEETLEWSLHASVTPLQEFVNEINGLPLVAVGSGGSATAAHFAAILHRITATSPARYATPLDVMMTEPNLSGSAVWLFSASGNNHDVLATLEHCIRRNVQFIGTLCMRKQTKLGSAAMRYDRAFVLEDHGPAKRDGFLATNSLLASCVMVARACGVIVPSFMESFKVPDLPELKGQDSVVILHGGWSSPVATDLESKLNESAMLSAQTSDYRNFGHGRHLRLARRPNETLVIALVTPETNRLAAKTLSLFPDNVQVVVLETDRAGPSGTLDLLVQGFWLIGEIGQQQSFDPGRPSVPEFGRRIYHLPPSVQIDKPPPPVTRKVAALGLGEEAHGEWQTRLYEFVERLDSLSIGGLVLDFDGTICAPSERYTGVSSEVASELRRLVEAGIVLGIASGRGRSVRDALQKALPEQLWPSISVGYYNGGQIGTLNDNTVPIRVTEPIHELGLARDLLNQDNLVLEYTRLEVRKHQITIVPTSGITTESLSRYIMEVLAPIERLGIRTLASSHSVDVLPAGVSKLSVIQEIMQKAMVGTGILSIGDRGAWPGNDTALLANWPSLSVDEVSGSPTVCWNLAPAGVIGVRALNTYLQAIEVSDGVATIRASGLWDRVQ